MSRQTFIFVGTTAQNADLVRLVEHALGRRSTHQEGSDPYIRTESVAIYIGGHEFDDDDITWPEGSAIPLHSNFPGHDRGS